MNPTSCWIRGWSSCASLARSSASCQFPANHSIRAWAARTCARRRSSPRAAAFVPISSSNARARSSSPWPARRLLSDMDGLSLYCSCSPSRCSISTPRSTRPGVKSPARPSAIATCPIMTAISSGSPMRSAFSRAARVSTSAASISAWKTRIQPRYPRIRACRISSPAALASASSRRSIVVCGSAFSVEASSKRTSDRSRPSGTSVRIRSSSRTARAPSPARRWDFAARNRRCRSNAGSSGVRSAASSESSAAAAVAPRAPACSAAASRYEAATASGPSTDSAMWRARSSTSATARASAP